MPYAHAGAVHPFSEPPGQKTGPTLRAAAPVRPTRSLRRRLTRALTQRRTTRRYSLDKFHELDAYCTHVTWQRLTVVLLVVPLPGLAASILPCMLHLRAVRDGPNVGFVLHLACAVASSVFGFLLTWLQVTSVPRATYSITQLLVVTTLTTVLNVALVSSVCFYVLFPIPFAWVLATPALFTALGLAHLVVLRSRLWTHPVLRKAAQAYMPSAFVQVSQIVLYPAISVLFDNVSSVGQVVLTLAFPFIKYALKVYLRKVSIGLKDFSAEVAVCGVEITASLYQSMIMQTSPTLVAMVCIIGFDLAQGLTMVKIFMDTHSTTLPGDATRVTSATSIVESVLPHRHQLIPLARILLRTTSMGTAIVSAATAVVTADADAATDDELVRMAAAMSVSDRRRMLGMALETLYAAEEILLTQYIEVIVPVVNAVFVAVATQFSSGRYNTRLAPFYEPPSSSRHSLASALQSIALYSFLQAMTLVIMQALLKRRYGLSAMSYLAFILEHHGLSIMGKMMAWLPVILHFTVLHYGTDFTFSFDWKNAR